MARKTNPKSPLGSKKIRFVIVGGANTAIDFALYNLLSRIFALSVANMISSFIAMLFSFFVNKKWTFRSTDKDYLREVTLFFIFTIIGIWVIQSGTIWLIENTFSNVDWKNFWLKNILKIIASVPSLIWNYITYNRFVFRSKKD